MTLEEDLVRGAVELWCLFVAILALLVVGCTPAERTAAEADTMFGAQLQACVQDAKSREEADGCRARIEAAWFSDGGADGAEGGDR